MTHSKIPGQDSISLRRPDTGRSQPLLNEEGMANLSRESLFHLFAGNPDALRRLAPFFQLEEGEEMIPVSPKTGR